MEQEEDANIDLAGPLQGLQVLELGNMISGPTAGCLLADFGARVVKVEHPRDGDDLRRWPPFKDGVPLWWKVTNRNKELITLNLSTEAGQSLVCDMIRRFDILIENFRPGTLERWGLGYNVLSAINPRLILVRISGYGQTGPYSRRPGYGTVAEAMSGAPSFTGFPDKPPTFSAFTLVDELAATFAVQGALMAVYERDVVGSGRGQVVDVSLFESLFRLIDPQVIAFDQLGLVKRRNGNRLEEDSPRNAYRTSGDEYIAISAGSQRTFARLAMAMGMPELPTDPRFSNNELRCANADALDEIVAQWFSSLTLDEAMSRLEAADVVAGPVYDIRRIFEDPHYQARDDLLAVPDPDLGVVRMQGVVPKFSRTPGFVRHTGRNRGEGNQRYYRDELGVDPGRVESLEKEGVI